MTLLLAHCTICRRSTLLGVDEVEYVHNLASGLISVTGKCPREHVVVILTGQRFGPPAAPTFPTA